MKYRALGKTGLMVSEIGLGGEWLERHNTREVRQVIDACQEQGINILDCWMSEPNVRSNIGAALKGRRDKWYIQGHFGSTWQNGQYVRSRDIDKANEAFQDLLTRLQTDYIDLGMIHFVDEQTEYDKIMGGKFLQRVKELKAQGIIHHIGMSTHNPLIAKQAALSREIELILFSVNPAFDLLPASEDINTMFADKYDEGLEGIAPEREELYRICEEKGVAINVMKGYAGGRLFSAKASPFGVALTPVQCIHYALTRPGVVSIMTGCETPEQVAEACAYETADEEEKNYAAVLASAPIHAYTRGQCTYCGHCTPCPMGIDIAMVNKLYDLASMHQETPTIIKTHYQQLSANADDCIACGGCEKRCPFGVKVIERMEKAKSILG